MTKFIALALVLVLSIGSSNAQNIEFNQRLLPTPQLSNAAEHFGKDVSILDDFAVVGATGYNGERGRAFVLQNINQNWEIIAQLTASDGEVYDNFGSAVEITESYIIVSAPNNNNLGALYIFERPDEGWVDATETGKIIASDSDKSKSFGNSFDAYDDYIIVSACDYYNSNSACYLVKKSLDGWNASPDIVKIEPSILSNKDLFGNSVSIYEDYLAIGAYSNNDKYVGCGVAYIYKIDTNNLANTTLVNELYSDVQDTSLYFGYTLLLREKNCYVGAKEQENTGIIYAYERSEDGWSSVIDTAKLTFNNTNKFVTDYNDDQLLVGCTENTAYIFERPQSGVWQDTTYSYSLPNFSDGTNKYYTNYSFSGNNIICSEYNKDEIDKASGVVYILNKTTDSWKNAIQEQKIVSNSPFLNNSFDLFGNIMAANNNVTVVANTQTNEAFVYEQIADKWERVATLTPSDSEIDNGFGSKIDIDSNTIVVLASSEISGGIYIFEKPENGWCDTIETAKLTINQKNRSFSNVAISEDVIIAGAGNRSDSSEVYLFEKTNNMWKDATETAILTHSGTLTNRFGEDLAIHKDIIVVNLSWNEKQVFLYKKPENGWTNMNETAILTPSDLYDYSLFGISLGVYNGVVAVGTASGAYTSDHRAFLYIEPETGWEDMTESVQLKPSDPIDGVEFGNPIAIYNDMVVIGGIPTYSNNSVYIYKKPETGWENMTEIKKLTAPENHTSQQSFGSSVNITQNNLFVGAMFDIENGTEAGAVYIYDFKTEPVTKTEKINTLPFATIYPNPGSNNLTIDAEHTGEITLEFYNLQGKLVKHAVLNTNSRNLNVSELSNALYIIKIVAGNESCVYTYSHLKQ